MDLCANWTNLSRIIIAHDLFRLIDKTTIPHAEFLLASRLQQILRFRLAVRIWHKCTLRHLFPSMEELLVVALDVCSKLLQIIVEVENTIVTLRINLEKPDDAEHVHMPA